METRVRCSVYDARLRITPGAGQAALSRQDCVDRTTCERHRKEDVWLVSVVSQLKQ